MKRIPLSLLTSALLCHSAMAADSITKAITSGTTSANLNLRYETVKQNNSVKDASALTLRTRIGYTTGTYKNFSAMLEMEDSRIIGGQDEYTVGPTGFNPGTYSVIGDPEHTEVDQAFIKYSADGITTKLGRQVLTYDAHRFIGHVGWRQDRQTFDAFKFDYAVSKNLNMSYSYLYKRNRIFAEAADIDSKDSLLNVSYNTSLGKLVAYGYLLEKDNNTDNALDTYGMSFNGKVDGVNKIKYKVEYATQSSKNGATDYDANYLALEGSVVVSGITMKLGYESLGSDKGAYGFSTPLATLHKFNGFADQFLTTPTVGLVDTYVTIATKLAVGKVVLTYHDFSADESSATVDDLGSEIDFVYSKKLNKNYVVGVKYAAFSAGDTAAGKVDTDKLWLWGTLKF